MRRAVDGIWLLQGASLLVVLANGVFVVRHETLLALAGGAGSGAEKAEEPGDDVDTTKGDERLKFGRGEVVFTHRDLDPVRFGGDAPVEGFVDRHGLDPVQAEKLRGLLAEYMTRINEIKMMEYRGAYSAEEVDKLVEAEGFRRRRAVQVLLGEDLARELESEIGSDLQPFPRQAAAAPPAGP